MKIADVHVHSNHSHDGRPSFEELIAYAKKNGVNIFCATDHCDYDLYYGECTSPFMWRQLDEEKYYNDYVSAKQTLEADKNNTLTMLFGIEAGFSDMGTANEKYVELINKYPFDEVINSVHCVDGKEAYFKNFFLFKSKKQAYGDYLETVLRSLDAPYPYEIVAHIGYITHGAPYRDKSLKYSDFPELFDKILTGIIERGKTLEVNFHHAMAPGEDVLRRYYELGGREISYGGDSHRGEVGERVKEFADIARSVGFDHYNAFVAHKPVALPFDRA